MVGSQLGPYIVLPRRGIHGSVDVMDDLLDARPRVRSIDPPWPIELGTRLLHRLQLPDFFGDSLPQAALVLDTMQRTERAPPAGPRLVVLSEDIATMLNTPASPVRALPLVEYDAPGPVTQSSSSGGGSGGSSTGASITVRVTCQDSTNGNLLEGAKVTAQTSVGDVNGVTNASGYVDVPLTASSVIHRLYVKPPPGYWGTYVDNPTSFTLGLQRVNLLTDDCVRHYFKSNRFTVAKFNAASGVRAGVVDTGVYPHRDLTIARARNTVTGEPANATDDVNGHGTHVSGLIAASGGVNGMAPGLPLYSYRVFKQSTLKATNYAVLKAIIFAEQDNCDILNISLGDGTYDAIVEEAIADARNHGMLVVAAAGTGGNRSLAYPGAYTGALPVAAIGRRGTYPVHSIEELDYVSPPATADPDEFIARFSNYGHADLVVAPGVGAVSTQPNDKYGPASGTSMAAPVIAGIAACLLSQPDPNVSAIFNAARDVQRADDIRDLLLAVCAPLGFVDPNNPGISFDGRGMPDPSRL